MTIRITALLKRRPDITHEQFSKHWSENHAAIFTSLQACKFVFVQYSRHYVAPSPPPLSPAGPADRFHVDPAHSDAFAKIGLTVAPYDGAADFEVEKVEDWLAVFGDREFKEKADPDELHFLDRSSVLIMVGHDQPKYSKERA